MEGKIIVGIISAFILVITATFINSENLSKPQKNILFILIIFPPAQWILGVIFLNLNRNDSNKSIYKNEENVNISTQKKLNNNTTTNQEKFVEKRILLEKSLKMNLITKIEFDAKITNLDKEKNKFEKVIKDLENFEESKAILNKLYENKIITKEEFALKIENIENQKFKTKNDENNLNISIIQEKKVRTNLEENIELKNKNNYLLFFNIIMSIILLILIIFLKFRE
jgi:hypothetical protein